MNVFTAVVDLKRLAGWKAHRRHAVIAALLVVLCCVGLGQGAPAKPLLWIEGESAQRSQTHRNGWFDAVDALELSGGAQIGSFSEPGQSEGWAEYDVPIPEEAAYHFWVRANLGSGMTYSVDGAPATKLDQDALQREDDQNRNTPGYVKKFQQWFNVAADGVMDARNMGWYRLPDQDLAQGTHTVRFNLGGGDGSKARFAAVDCFALTAGDFSPNYQYKPGETPKGIISDPTETTWSFDPAQDTLAPTALLDLRFLNEKTAGEHGFIRLSPDGSGFVRGDGVPIRFWGGSDYAQRIAYDRKDQAVLEHHAQFLAKRGVNIVRLHGAIEPKGADSKLEDVDAAELDQMYRLVAAMKKAGIYTMIDPYWAVQAHAQRLWGVPDSENGNLTGLIFFDKTLQKGYKAWLRRLYADVNPYTGIPLAKDPAIAMIQLQNEDSMLFWTMQSVKGPALLELRDLFGKFVLHKYGSFERAMSVWQNYKADDDDFAHQRPGLFIVWELTEDARNKKGQAPGREARLADQTEFFARTMFDFNKEMVRYLRQDLGCKQLVLPGNWRTADQVVLDDAERWSYTAGDVIAKNHYWTGVHNGINTGWQILAGQVYTSHSWIKDPIGSPLGIRQVVGHPFVLPESLWVPPTHYESEAPLIVAAQSSLTGLGTFFWFATGEIEWQEPLRKWTYSIPTTLGQFPAAALAYRKGYIAEGPAVVHEERRLEDVFHRKMPLIVEEGAWDPNRDTGSLPAGTPYKAAVDPLAYLVGRAEVKYGGDPAKSRVLSLDKYIDRAAQRVKSVTGQITTDMKRGLYLVDAPRIQGAAGFLGGAGKQTLTDVDLDCHNAYASVVVASLDGAPISRSHKVLVEVGTESRPTGWKERSMMVPVGTQKLEGRRILDTGHGPWRILKADLSVTIRNPALHVARILDANGNPVGTAELRHAAKGVVFKFPDSALYVVLE